MNSLNSFKIFYMSNSVLDVIVIGAGHAGLSASYYLSKLGLKHMVFERGKIGESWRSQRWDSFKLNTANKVNVLPGSNYNGNDPDGFSKASEFFSLLNDYAAELSLPVSENMNVISIEKIHDTGVFHVVAIQKGYMKSYYCRQVIIASGTQNEKSIPDFAKQISSEIKQLHSSEYRNPDQLPGGAVLVVGSAQSGVQVAQDLITAGRNVYLSTSMVPRIPRTYRGRDIMDWLIQMNFFDMTADQIRDSSMLHIKAPQLTGTGNGGSSISLQSLAKAGAVILGKMKSADEENIFFESNAAMHVQFADQFSQNVKEMIDGFIESRQLIAPAPEEDVADTPDENASCASSITSAHLLKHSIRSIIWSTGLTGNFDYLKLPVFKEDGSLRHYKGIAAVPGLYFLGLPWLRSRKSSLICGIKDDAEFICENVYEYSQRIVVGNAESLLSRP